MKPFIGGKGPQHAPDKLRRLHLTMNNPMICKVAVMSVLQRGAKGESKVRLERIRSTRRRDVSRVLDEIVPGSTIHSDALLPTSI